MLSPHTHRYETRYPLVSIENLFDILRERNKNHPSVLAILGWQVEEILLEILPRLKLKMKFYSWMAEGSQQFVIMTNPIKMNADIFANFLSTEINKAIDLSKFPSCLKIAVVTPVVKEGTRSEKDNYRSVSILQSLSKVFERCLLKQISPFFHDIFSKYQFNLKKPKALNTLH